ncbi:hypothetical protein [Ralstonia pseudosolanacearum]|uniref:hypothetical protein n=1 Tax=Ralstonia pseudosolanacearum TaxID=1310165 RepID=UPI001FF717BB|nr:hypothetical protein [Ralstonia pseudosolanacearum]
MNRLATKWLASLAKHIKQYGLSPHLMLVLGVTIIVSLLIAIWAAWQLVVLYEDKLTHKADHSNGIQEPPVMVLKLDIHIGHLSTNDSVLPDHYGTACCWPENLPMPLIPDD